MTDINVNALSEAINDKADRDLSNLSNQGKEKIVYYMSPDYNNYTDITLPASGETYTVPHNGLFCWAAQFSNNNGYISIDIMKNGALARKIQINSGYTSTNSGFEMNVEEGDVLTFYYTNISNNRLTRIYKYKA